MQQLNLLLNVRLLLNKNWLQVGEINIWFLLFKLLINIWNENVSKNANACHSGSNLD